ncbi:DUF2809 domain-containing protein [Variovorax sp. LT1R16]|uniref:ribosomal maturation YjgA family protein n=1 Tax=Variovorax sp. LT1R16 TaxID=3443728 RepID=UPI003F46D612
MEAMIRGMTLHSIDRPAFAWRLDSRAGLAAVILFILLALLATVGARAGWLRSFFGDVLAVAWLYFVFKTVVAARPWQLALAAFGSGCLLELGQYLAKLWHWQIPNPVLRILLGSTPDGLDVLAYAIGGAAVWWTDVALSKGKNR